MPEKLNQLYYFIFIQDLEEASRLEYDETLLDEEEEEEDDDDEEEGERSWKR